MTSSFPAAGRSPSFPLFLHLLFPQPLPLSIRRAAFRPHRPRAATFATVVTLAALAACGDGGSGAATASGANPSAHPSASPAAPASPTPAAASPKATPSRYVAHRVVALGTPATTRALSGSGHVAGLHETSGTPEGKPRPFVWSTATGVQEIPGLIPPDAATDGDFEITAVNNAGVVVGSAPDGFHRFGVPFAWSRESGPRSLDSVDPAWSSNSGTARDINDAGQIVGTYRFANFGIAGLWNGLDQVPVTILSAPRMDVHGERINESGRVLARYSSMFSLTWSEGDQFAVPLPRLGDQTPLAQAISDTGYIISHVRVSEQTEGPEGPVRRSFVRLGLVDPGGAIHAAPVDIPHTEGFRAAVSNEGAVVASHSADSRPFYWTVAGGVRDLLGEAGVSGQARSISPAGAVVGRFQVTAETPPAAFVWTSDGGFVNLNDRLDPAAGIHLDEALEVNDAGMVLASANGGLVLLVPEEAAADGGAEVPADVPAPSDDDPGPGEGGWQTSSGQDPHAR